MEIVRLADDRVEDASAMLARAFMNDPAWAWVVPSSKRRAALLPWLFRVNFEVTEAQAWTTDGDVFGCARWLSPGATADPHRPMLRALVATPLRAREATSRFFAYGRAVEAMRAAAVPEPHWYLAGIGVDPARRRSGIGTALMQPGLDGVRSRPGSLRAAHKQRGEPRLLRDPGLRGRSRGANPRRGAASVDDAAQAVHLGSARRRDSQALPRQRRRSPRFVPRRNASRREARAPRSAGSHGRVLARREMGKLTFLDLVDRSGRIQLLCPLDRTGEVDVHLGDIIGVTGHPVQIAARRAVTDMSTSSNRWHGSGRRSPTPSTA